MMMMMMMTMIVTCESTPGRPSERQSMEPELERLVDGPAGAQWHVGPGPAGLGGRPPQASHSTADWSAETVVSVTDSAAQMSLMRAMGACSSDCACVPSRSLPLPPPPLPACTNTSSSSSSWSRNRRGPSRRCTTPPCPRSKARLLRSPIAGPD